MNEQVDLSELETKPLQDWKNAPTTLQLKQVLSDAKPSHDAQQARIKVWLDNLNVEGSAKIKTAEGNSSIQPKLIRKQAEWRYPALSEPFLSTQHLFKVKPRTWEDRERAQQNELVLNQQINKLDKVRFVDEYVRAAVDEGTVVVEVGWEFEEEAYQAEVPDVQFHVDPSVAPLHEELAKLKAESPSQYELDVPDELKEAHEMTLEQGVPIKPVIVGKKTVTKMRTLVNRPTAEVCESNNVIFDPSCKGDIEKAGFAIKSFESCLAVLQKDKRYKNLDKINIEGTSVLAEPDHKPDGGDHNFNFSDKARKKFVVYVYYGTWDIEGDGKLVSILVAWVGNTIIRMEETPFPDKKLPFVVEHYLPVRRSIYGEPDGELLADNQKVVGAVTRGMIDLLGKSANGQTGFQKGMLDITNRRKFDKGQDYEFNPNVDPRLGIHMHTYPEIPNSAGLMIQLQTFEAESMTGVKSFSGNGMSGDSLGDVAAGIRGVLDAASKRELAILRRLSNGMVKIGRKFISMSSEFLDEKEVVRVTNDEYITVRRDDLAGDFDLELSISTAEEDNNKAEQLAFLLQTTGNNMDPQLRNMILADIARLRKMPDMAHKIESYVPQPDPVAQKLKELEIAKLEAEIQELRAKALKFQTAAGLDQAKVGTEVAKAENLSADTDTKNLNFVEQESGVTQERAKELHGEQARSQAQLKLVEHGLDAAEKQKDRENDLLKEYVKLRAKSISKK